MPLSSIPAMGVIDERGHFFLIRSPLYQPLVKIIFIDTFDFRVEGEI